MSSAGCGPSSPVNGSGRSAKPGGHPAHGRPDRGRGGRKRLPPLNVAPHAPQAQLETLERASQHAERVFRGHQRRRHHRGSPCGGPLTTHGAVPDDRRQLLHARAAAGSTFARTASSSITPAATRPASRARRREPDVWRSPHRGSSPRIAGRQFSASVPQRMPRPTSTGTEKRNTTDARVQPRWMVARGRHPRCGRRTRR